MEVITVMAIIAILAAIAAPHLASARQRAEQTVTVNHLRQSAMALSLYRSENDGDGKLGKPTQMGLPPLKTFAFQFGDRFMRPLPCSYRKSSDYIYWALDFSRPEEDPEPWEWVVAQTGEQSPLISTTDCTDPGINRLSVYERKLGLAVQLDLGLIRRTRTGNDSRLAWWKD
ncbi:MAG: hypothetical protein JNJ45_09805 [Chthonomonas sp.]|nr:hypothetical protein [Chthonomonas sp.]